MGVHISAGGCMVQQMACMSDTTKHAFISPLSLLMRKPGRTSSDQAGVETNVSSITARLIFIIREISLDIVNDLSFWRANAGDVDLYGRPTTTLDDILFKGSRGGDPIHEDLPSGTLMFMLIVQCGTEDGLKYLLGLGTCQHPSLKLIDDGGITLGAT